MAQLKDGPYRGRLKSAVTTKAQHAGTLQVNLQFTLDHHWDLDRGAWMPVPEGTERTIYLSCHSNALPYTLRKLETLGWNGSFQQPTFAPEAYEEGVDLVAESDTYQGRTRQRFELTNWGGAEVETAPESDLRALEARVKAMRPRPRPRNAPAPGSGPAPGSAPESAPPASAPPGSAPPVSAPPAVTAPAATSPTAATCLATTRDEAWRAWCDGVADGAPSMDEWSRAVAARASSVGRTEAAFTAEDWEAVARVGGIPI